MEIRSATVDLDEFNLLPLDGVIKLKLRRQEVLLVPIIFSMACGHFIDWDRWIDKELKDVKFMNLLMRSQIYSSVLVSGGLNMKKILLGCNV